MDFPNVNNKLCAGENTLRRYLTIISISAFNFVLQWKVFLQLLIWAQLISAVSYHPWFCFLLLFLIKLFCLLSKENWQNVALPSPFPLVFYILVPKSSVFSLIISTESTLQFMLFNLFLPRNTILSSNLLNFPS